MKFSNSTEFRFGSPKYSQLITRMIRVASGCFLISWLSSEPAKTWFDEIRWLALIAMLLVFLAGKIAERKDLEATHKIAPK